MKRKLISVITVLAICLTLVIPSASVFAETELPYWDKAVTIEGRTLTLTITSKNASGLLGGGTVELGYDPELLQYVDSSDSGLAFKNGMINGLSDNNSFVANFALATSLDSDATLVTAHFNIADGKVCPSNPFTVIRDKLVYSGNATTSPKQVNIDSEGNVITPAISFTCSHTIEGDWEITKQPSATENGERIKKCAVCQQVIKTETIEKLGDAIYWKKTVTVEGRKVKLVIESVNGAGKLAGGNVTMTYDSDVLTFNSEGSSTKIGADFGSLGFINPNKAGRYIVNFAGLYPIENDGVITVAMFDIAEGKVCTANTFALEKEEFSSSDPGIKLNSTTAPIEFTCMHKNSAESVITEPTCEGTGVKGITCSDCGNATRVTIDALGHNEGEGTVTTEPTCENEGVRIFNCTRCQKELRTEKIDALGHDWDEGAVTTEPTCEGKGVKTLTCKRCDATKTEEVSAKGHTADEGTRTEPTCTEPGKLVVKCKDCGKVLSETVIPANRHIEDEGTVVTEPTCTVPGKLVIKCKNCGETISEKALPAKGHTAGEEKVEVEPTLTTEGVSRVRCTVCNEILKETILPKLLKYGDVDTNGTVNIMDAIMLLRYNAELESLTSAQELAADVDGNGNIGIEDTLLILRYDAELIASFPVENKK